MRSLFTCPTCCPLVHFMVPLTAIGLSPFTRGQDLFWSSSTLTAFLPDIHNYHLPNHMQNWYSDTGSPLFLILPTCIAENYCQAHIHLFLFALNTHNLRSSRTHYLPLLLWLFPACLTLSALSSASIDSDHSPLLLL